MESLCVLLLLLVTVTAQGDGSCNEGDVDLIQDEGSSVIVGYVRYCWEGQWRSVCRKQEHNWDSNEAKVACRQLGYQGDVSGTGCPSDLELDDSTFINDTVTTLCNASLNGNESSLQDCIISTNESCRCHRTARLQCDPVCSLGELRLVPMSNNSVEVCVGGRWIKDQTNFSEGLAEYICGSPTQSIPCYECCTDQQQGHYRVENDTVLQVCVDQQWTTVQNTSQLLTLVQEDIDQLINETLTQCPINNACLSTPPTNETETTATSAEQSEISDNGALIGIVVILMLALLATAAGWIVTCVVTWKKWKKNKPKLQQNGLTETDNKVDYHYLEPNEFYERAPRLQPSAPIDQTYSAVNSHYQTVAMSQEEFTNNIPPIPTPMLMDYAVPDNQWPNLDNYDVVKGVNPSKLAEYDVLSRCKGVESSPVIQSSAAVSDETLDEFHDVEQHVYAAVDKKDKNTEDDDILDLAADCDEETESDEEEDSDSL